MEADYAGWACRDGTRLMLRNSICSMGPFETLPPNPEHISLKALEAIQTGQARLTPVGRFRRYVYLLTICIMYMYI